MEKKCISFIFLGLCVWTSFCMVQIQKVNNHQSQSYVESSLVVMKGKSNSANRHIRPTHALFVSYSSATLAFRTRFLDLILDKSSVSSVYRGLQQLQGRIVLNTWICGMQNTEAGKSRYNNDNVAKSINTNVMLECSVKWGWTMRFTCFCAGPSACFHSSAEHFSLAVLSGRCA